MNQEIVDVLKKLLDDALSGELVSLQYIGFDKQGNYNAAYRNCNLQQLSLASLIVGSFAQKQLDFGSKMPTSEEVQRAH